MKACSACRETKDLSGFYRERRNKDGLSYICKACHRESVRRSREKSPDYREKDRVRSRAYMAAHPDVAARAQERYRSKAENIEKLNAWQREYTQRNLAKKAEYYRAWRQTNPASASAQRHRRRALLNSAPGAATPEQISGRVAMWGEKCWVCSEKYAAMDHVKPLIKGGSNWPANLRPICKSCNGSKGGRWNGVHWAHGLRTRGLHC